MEFTILKTPCLLYEAFAMASNYFNQRSYAKIAESLLERYGGAMKADEIAELKTMAGLLDRFMNEACADMNTDDQELAFYLKPFNTGRKTELNCIGRVLLFSLLSLKETGFEEQLVATKVRWNELNKHGLRIMDFNNAGIYLMRADDDPMPPLFEQIYALHYPSDAKLDTYHVLSDFDASIDRLGELLRPYAEKIAAGMARLSPAYEAALHFWQSYIAEDSERMSALVPGTEASVDTASEHLFNVALFLFNEIGYGNSPLNENEHAINYYIGLAIRPCFGTRHVECKIDRLTETMKALSDPAKLDILVRLCRGSGYCLELSKETGINAGNVSRHLNTLFDCGLLTKERRGGRTYYRTDASALHTALSEMETYIVGGTA